MGGGRKTLHFDNVVVNIQNYVESWQINVGQPDCTYHCSINSWLPSLLAVWLWEDNIMGWMETMFKIEALILVSFWRALKFQPFT